MRAATTTRSKRFAATLASGLLALSVAGCGGEFNIREEVGLSVQGPDEFTVVKKKPLEMPDNMSALPEPRPGAPSRVEPNASAAAQAALTGRPAPDAATAPAASEAALLAAAGAGEADPSIRTELEEEKEPTSELLLDRLFGGGEDEKPKEALDPKEEAERLADEARQGKNPGLEKLPEDDDASAN